MDFCEPEAAFREIVCGRQTEIRNPHEVVFAVFPEPVKKPPFIFFIVSAMVALILPVPHFHYTNGDNVRTEWSNVKKSKVKK